MSVPFAMQATATLEFRRPGCELEAAQRWQHRPASVGRNGTPGGREFTEQVVSLAQMLIYPAQT